MNYTIIDVREPYEFDQGHTNGAINIPLGKIESGSQKLRELQKDTPILVYCNSGNRSSQAQAILHKIGFSNVANGMNKDHAEQILDR